MTIFEDIEERAKLLGPIPERIPTKIKMTMETYTTIFREKTIEQINYTGPSRFDAVYVTIDNNLEVPWIMYDQHGEEMGRAQ